MSELTPNLDLAGIADAATEPDTTRREAMRRGLTAGGALAAALTVPLLLRTQSAFAQAESDTEILEAAATAEAEAVVIYETMAESGLLRGPVGEIITLFGNQEEEHFNALVRLLEDMGGEEPEKPEPAAIEGLGGLIGEPQMLSFAIDLENRLIKEYVEAFQNLTDPEALKTTSQIMSNEGQHLVMLRLALGASPVDLVPSAFETGTDPAPQAGLFGP
jgi:rubrerythrin